MAKIKPVQNDPKPSEAPTLTETPKSIQSVSEPYEIKAHQLQFFSDNEGHNWRCSCGHVYPYPPVEVLLNGTLDEWLDPLIEEHEKT
jgi:hypothetical protein